MKAVPLHYENPPSLFTMLKSAGRFLFYDGMEQRFNNSGCGLDLRTLREFCQREGKVIDYRKGEQFEREGDPA